MAAKKIISKNWRDAATLVIAAEWQDSMYKILLMKRSPRSKFMPNAYVFPGGVKDPADFSKDWKEIFDNYNVSNNTHKNQKRTLETISRPLGTSAVFQDSTHNRQDNELTPELGFRITALRETFEESGILIANSKEGETFVLSNPDEVVGGPFKTLGRWRERVYENPKYFLQLFHTMKCAPSVEQLYEWSTWLTPLYTQTKRFNALFYVTFLTESVFNKIATNNHDHGEVVEMVWDTPLNYLQQRDDMIPPPQRIELLRFMSDSKLTPNVTSLYEWSNWLTPTFHKQRFHARFYVCFVDHITLYGLQDNRETVDLTWLRPLDTMQQYGDGEITLQIPQVYEMCRFSMYPTFKEFKDFTEEREKLGLDLWCPHKVVLKDGFAVTYPGDSFHVDDPYAEATDMSEMDFYDLQKQSSSLNRVELHDKEEIVRIIRNDTTWFGHPPFGTINVARDMSKL